MTMAYDTNRLVLQRLSEHLFLGTVATAGVSGNRIKVTRPGQAAADATFYAAASGLAATVATGDTVLVAKAGASWVVICKVVT
jgi:hypothetical protein